MQTGYQYCATLTTAICALCRTEAAGTGVRSFDKFNCALMSVNLRQPDAIWEPDCPVRRAEERDRGLPKRKQTQCLLVETNCMTNILLCAGNIIDYVPRW